MGLHESVALFFGLDRLDRLSRKLSGGLDRLDGLGLGGVERFILGSC